MTYVAEFLVLRAPLLARDALSKWATGVQAPAACAEDDESLRSALDSDRVLLRERLAALAADDQLVQSLELASPDLVEGVACWRREPAAKRSRSAERSLVRYITRTASRPDLFGLAGAYVIGQFSDDARLELGARSELVVSARVDSGLLQDVVRRAASDASDDPGLVVRRNPGVYAAAGRLRVAARVPGSTKHRLVAIRPTPAIEIALQAATDGATVGALVAALVAAGSPADHAATVIGRLIASDLLVPAAQITVTGSEPGIQALRALRAVPGGESCADGVQRAVDAVAQATRIGSETISAVAAAIEPAGVEVKRRRCLQVDARRPGTIRLPVAVRTEMLRAVDLLARIVPPHPSTLAAFTEAFERRFATRSVRLLEALDPDFGVRLEPQLFVPVDWDPGAARRRRALLELVERGRASDSASVELTAGDLEALERPRPAAVPRAFTMLTRLIARDAAAAASGNFQLVEPDVNGPSGVRPLGRLCRSDPELEAHVREHLEREAALDPECLYAELSVTPETDAGLNITQRPLLREWEIDYGGASGAQDGRRLDPADLMVSIDDGEVLLRSVAHDRRVVPSSTVAMNPLWVSLPAARFLLLLAFQGTAANLSWHWGELANAPELPRVTSRRTILSLRRWNVTESELADVRPGTDATGFRRLRDWRAQRGVPRLVDFEHPTSKLLVDFDNVLSVDAFLSAARDIGMVRLVETPVAEPSPVHGPDGRYAHELIVPFVQTRPRAPRARMPRSARPVGESRRRFPPGTEWLYANLYGPVASADRVLLGEIGPLADRLRGVGLVDRWFFIRYADPERHLRVRFHGRPVDLLGEVLPALRDAAAPALADGQLYRISLDTYEREVERYGGLEGVDLMELLAEADSDAVIAMLGRQMSAVERRHLAVASIAGLYAGAQLPLEVRHACCARLRDNWAPGPGVSLGALLGGQERAERSQLAAVVVALERGDPGPGVASLRGRSRTLAPIFERLRALEANGILERDLEDVMCSLAHMSVNRLLKRGANDDELRVHDALARLYEAQIARARARRRAHPTAGTASS